ncbi:MAG: hypothetical protein DRP45_05010, partial [Candidatus Zixiibacteriota bacterium]
YLVSPRWNQRAAIDRSFYHDAGDYFKFDPGFLILEQQVTPMRKTVQPYGLSGDRLGFLIGGRSLSPFEHSIEPDGLCDLNDIPTALDHKVAILPGPVGMVLGGRHATATLLTQPGNPDSTPSQSAFVVDKGSFGYSYARGKYSKRFTGGREIDMSIGYRVAEGPAWNRYDNAYHYTADLYFPAGQTMGFRANGWLYARGGPVQVRPDIGGDYINRNRIDRYVQLSWVAHDDDHQRKYEFGYRHWHQGSTISRDYEAWLRTTENELFLSREWIAGQVALKAEVSGDHFEYNNWHQVHTRLSGGSGFSLAWLAKPWTAAIDLRQRYVDGYKFLPSSSAMMSRESERLFFMLAVGYSERAPSLHELHLPYQAASIYNFSEVDYADGGYANLVSERQLIGSAEIKLGTIDNCLGVSVTGGRIKDGIDWYRELHGDTSIFSPINGDIDFGTVTGRARIGLGDILHLNGGGSYHFLEYEHYEDKSFSPEYQCFSGLEMHVYWPQKLIHFYAYGEFVYTGPYHGYRQTNLGNVGLLNLKFSFRMGDFRFHWVIQNATSSVYSARDYIRFPGRYNYFGFTWDFLD